ncbi:sigma E protease regulator RseP, partial [Salmonella enterica]
MLSILWNLAAFIIALGVLITVHEFGHFWVARRCGVRVERFSIGFGKALWRRTDRYGTEYVIALIPLGGYVKMLDERAEPVAPELRRHAFNNKTVGQRAAIIAAGPVANFIFAIFAYWLVFIIGVPGVRPVIGEITPNSIAAQAQIAPGTELKAVDGIETPDWDAVRLQLVSKIGDQQTTVSVAPFGSDQRQDKTLDLRHWAFEPDKQDPVSSLGIRPRGPQIETVLSEVQANSAASKAGLQAGDRIVKVDGQPLTQWMKFVTFVRDNPGKPLALEIERQGSALSLTLTPDTKSV